MKIVFTKLNTSDRNIYIDFGNGEGWQEFSVAEARANGVHIPNDCVDYSEIRMKGKSNVFNNADVITSIKVVEEENPEVIFGITPCDDSYGGIFVGYFGSENLDIDGNMPYSSLYIKYNDQFYNMGQDSNGIIVNSEYTMKAIKLNNALLPVLSEFTIDGIQNQKYEYDPLNLVTISSYTKGVGGTATIKGVEVDYVVKDSDYTDDNDYSTYRWSSENVQLINEEIRLFTKEDGFIDEETMMSEIYQSIIENDPHLYMKLRSGKIIRLPIIIGNNDR